jgi:hypothetical protein
MIEGDKFHTCNISPGPGFMGRRGGRYRKEIGQVTFGGIYISAADVVTKVQ